MRLFKNALWSPAGKGLTSWLSFVFSNCEGVTFPLVWCLIVSIPDLCTLSYFVIRYVRFAIMNNLKKYNLWSCQKACTVLCCLLDNLFIRLCSKLYRQIVGIPMGTNFAPLVADSIRFVI